MGKIIRLSAEQRENLTAYLDGELDDEATQQVEQVLASSEVARHEVDMLSRTWDMLNALPATKVSEDFTRRTLTSIRATERSRAFLDARAMSRSVRRGGLLALWTAALVACVWVGFQATNRWVPNEAEQLLDDFDVIANLDEYTAVGDIEFLRVLKDKRTLAEHEDSADK